MNTKTITCGWRCACGEEWTGFVDVELETEDGLNNSDDSERWRIGTIAMRDERYRTFKEHEITCDEAYQHGPSVLVGTHIATSAK